MCLLTMHSRSPAAVEKLRIMGCAISKDGELVNAAKKGDVELCKAALTAGAKVEARSMVSAPSMYLVTSRARVSGRGRHVVGMDAAVACC